MTKIYLLLLRAGVLAGTFFYGSISCSGQVNIGQLHILPGTTWVSTTETNVVLDNMDLQYDADPVLLNNTFRFTGMRINSIRGASRPLIYAVSLAKTDPGYVMLNQTIDVAKRINFERELLDLNGFSIFLQPFALLTNENQYSRLIGLAGGYITIDADMPSPQAANPGNLGAIITSANKLGKVTVTRGHDRQNLNDSSQSVGRWYDITPPLGATFTAKLRFTYLDPEAEGFPDDSLVLWQAPPGSDWVDIGYTNRDGSLKFVEKEGLTRFDRFTLYPGSSTPLLPPLAQNQTVLNGNWNNDRAALRWIVISEYQNDHFTVQRKYAGETTFTPIATLPTTAPGGTSDAPDNYVFTDSSVKTGAGDVFYRILQAAANGESTYSNTISLKAMGSPGFIRSLFPTIAVGGRVYIEVGNMPLAKMSFVIVDAKGSIVLTGDLPYQSQWLSLPFLSKGVYHLILRSGDQHWHSTFLK